MYEADFLSLFRVFRGSKEWFRFSPNSGEHARPGRGGTRPAFRIGGAVLQPDRLENFVRRPFSARARKTARGARALPVLFWSNDLDKRAAPVGRSGFVSNAGLRWPVGQAVKPVLSVWWRRVCAPVCRVRTFWSARLPGLRHCRRRIAR